MSRFDIKPSHLSTVIPAASNSHVQEILENYGTGDDEGDGGHPLAKLEQRRLLYFDETLTVYAILRLSSSVDDSLKAYISTLSVNLDVFAVGNRASASRSQENATEEQIPVREHLLSQSVEEDEEPIIMLQDVDTSSEDEASSSEKIVYSIWKINVTLRRPKTRLQNPFLAFSLSATPTTPQSSSDQSIKGDYLQSLVPSGSNLLGTFMNDPHFGPLKPRLSSNKISPIASGTSISTDMARPLSAQAKPLIPITSAVSTRLRFVPSDPVDGVETLICALDFAVSPFANCKVVVEKIKLQLSSGKVQPLTGANRQDGLPVTCKPRDEMIFLYRLAPSQRINVADPGNLLSHTLEIDVDSSAIVGKHCAPRIITKWNTLVTFESKFDAMRNSQRVEAQSARRQRSPPVLRPDSIPAMQSPQSPNTFEDVTEFGLVFTISGPPIVKLAQDFHWEVFVVNRSQRQMRVALIPIVKRRRVDGKKLPPRPVSTGGGNRSDDIADAVVDENIIYAMQKNANIELTELVCLSTDVRVGPLLPDACHTATLKFKPLRLGVVQVEALRIVDLSTQETTDIRDLPTSTCEE